MLNRFLSLFRSKPAPRLVIADRLHEQARLVIVDRLHEQVRAALEARQIAYLSELGGFDTSFDNAPQNWMRQAEILVEHKRRLDTIEAQLTKIID